MKEVQSSGYVDKEGSLQAEGNVGRRKQRRVSGVPSQQVVQAGVQFLHDQDGEAGGRKETYPNSGVGRCFRLGGLTGLDWWVCAHKRAKPAPCRGVRGHAPPEIF